MSSFVDSQNGRDPFDVVRKGLHDHGALTSASGTPETVGARLRRLRLERGLSQRELSSPGVSYAYISRIEADARRPSVKALRMLARKLGVSPDYLETGSELGDVARRELRLADAELRLRLEGDAPGEITGLLSEARTAGDETSAVRAEIVLGLAAAARGEHALAIELLERAITSELVTAASRPDVFATLGHSYSMAGDPRRAADLFERTLTDLKQLAPDDSASRVRFSTYLSYALTDLGDLRRANEVVEDALEISNEAADPYTRVRLYWSLGRIAYENSQPQTALEHFRRAVALLEATEDTIHLARAYLSCAAAALASTGDVADVARQIDQAVALLGSRPADSDLAIVRWLEAMIATRTGDAPRGADLAREAQRLAADVPNQRALATWALAEALTATGDKGTEAAWREATGALEGVGTVREHAESLRGFARFLRHSGRESEALDVLDRAASLAGTLANDSVAADR